MTGRLLTVDVGNTAASFALFALESRARHPRPIQTWTVSTPSLVSGSAALRKLLKRIKTSAGGGPLPSAVSSVVPRADGPLRSALREVFGVGPLFITPRVRGGVRIRYATPAEVGSDRIVNARAAAELTTGAAIIVDFGTATTFDCLSANREYLGGVIAPGPAISAEALYRRTAKLPRVLLTRPARVLGRNTMESIEAGLYHGYRGLVREIVYQLKRRLGGRAAVFATGGQANWVLRGVRGVDRYVPHLTHLGLLYYWRDVNQRNAKKRIELSKRRR